MEKENQLGALCFFNQHASDILQHIAVFFEAAAIYLVWHDYKNREEDIAKKGRATMIAGVPVPHKRRTKELMLGLVLGAIAVCMEMYQLASQYLGCD